MELTRVLDDAEAYGLRPADYGVDRIHAAALRLSDASTAGEWLQYDQLLTNAAVRLIGDLHYGRIDPRTAGFELPEPRRDLDVSATVAALAPAPDVTAAIAAIEPQFTHYALLKVALTKYRGLAAGPEPGPLPGLGRRVLHAGDRYPGAPSVRDRLRAEGDLAAAVEAGIGGSAGIGAAAVDDQLLDPALVAALERYQNRHGLAADGSLNAATLVALSTPWAQRVRQIELTLERWRWLPQLNRPPIIVNIPEFRLFAFDTVLDRAASILQMPVIVGQVNPSKETPVFMSEMKYVVFRPYWDVPRSIAVREMLPKIRAQADYLRRNHLEIVRGESDESQALDPTPAAIAGLTAGDLRLRQRPGDDNALGLIKFVFPNAHDVYLHSTPARELFLKPRRAFSHGCIRVSDPQALAVHVLKNADGTWDPQRVAAAMHDGDNVRVALRDPIPVMILYGTAMATEAGPVQFFDDIYGHDRKLASLLHLEPVNVGAAAR